VRGTWNARVKTRKREEGGNAEAQRTRREEEEKGVGAILKIDDV
jgi:hypothetical protein